MKKEAAERYWNLFSVIREKYTNREARQEASNAFVAGWEACADLCLKELGLTDGSREKLRKIRDGLPFEPIAKMKAYEP